MRSFGIGQPVSRKEDPRFLTGRGRYVADLDLPRQGYAVFLFSLHAHARIRSIAIAAAAGVPGVYAVLTGQDWAQDGLGTIDPEVMPEDMGGPKGHRTRRLPLAIGRVRYVGERVAVIIASSEAQARDAAELVAVDYEPLPVVVDAADAVALGAPLVHEDIAGNVAVSVRLGNVEAVEPAFARAAHITRLSLVNNRITAVTMEPRGCLAEYDPGTGRWTLTTPARPRHPPCAGASDSARAGKPHPGHCPRCRRRLRHEGPALPGGGRRRLGGAAHRPASQVDPDPRRGAPRRRRRPRSDRRTGRTGARRRRPHSRAALDRHAQCRRLYRGRRRDPAAVFTEARLDRVRHPGGFGNQPAGADQHGADRALSRRRPARGELPDRAPDRSGSARDAARSCRTSPPEPDRQLPLSDQDRLDLRQRQLPCGDAESPGACRLGRLSGAATGKRSGRPAARPRHRLLHGQYRHLQRAHGTALRSFGRADDPRRHAVARPGPRDRLYADGIGVARRTG